MKPLKLRIVFVMIFLFGIAIACTIDLHWNEGRDQIMISVFCVCGLTICSPPLIVLYSIWLWRRIRRGLHWLRLWVQSGNHFCPRDWMDHHETLNCELCRFRHRKDWKLPKARINK